MFFPLKKFSRKKILLVVFPLLIIIFSLLIFGAKIIYERIKEPDTYQPDNKVQFTPPVDTSFFNIQVKEPGDKALLPGAKWVPQTFNNCGPATTSMILQYFGFTVSQDETKQALRTNPTDTNVFTYEIASYLKTNYDIESKLLYGGNVELLKTLVANGFYVVVEDWLHPNEDIGHVTIIRGFDDEEKVFIADDSFIGVNITYPYEEFDQTQWKPFNREYLPLYKPGNEELLKKIVGDNWDEESMYKNAVDTARKEISKNDKDMYAWFNLGTSQYALKNYTDARLAFEKAYAIGWPRRMLWYQIQPIQTYNKLGDFEKAIEFADMGLRGNESFAELHLEKAIAYQGLGNDQKAREEVDSALRYAPNLEKAEDFKSTLTSSTHINSPISSLSLQSSVLGANDIGPVIGSPLIPPSYLTIYFVIYLTLLAVLYLYFYRKKRPLRLGHRIRLFVVLAFVLKASAILGISFLLLYWLVPAPQIRRTLPKEKSTTHSPMERIEIVFDKPVDRGELVKSISPEIPGRFVFEDSIYTTHLYRKLVFYPTYSFSPNTTYTISLSGIQNLIKVSKPYSYSFSFTTTPSPNVTSVSPQDKARDVDIDAPFVVNLDNPNNDVSEFMFEFTPQIDVALSVDKDKKTYTLTPKKPLKQGTTYAFKVKKSDIRRNFNDGSISERGVTTTEYEGEFRTKEAPGIAAFTPSGPGNTVTSDVTITFSEKMDRRSVQDNFTIKPNVAGRFQWKDDTQVTFIPNRLAFDTEYKITLTKGTKAQDGGFLEEDVIKAFKTLGKVTVSQFNPSNKLAAVNIHSPIEITFDQAVSSQSAQEKFSITPQTKGSFSWNGTTMIFKPESPLAFNTSYTVTVGKGIKSINGQDSDVAFTTTFTTQLATTRLSVPAYLQKYTLSCEIASLRMALNFRGANVSEDELIPLVGQDPTPHEGNTWGDPNTAFVGNIRGTQMADGYGVHWGPIAKAARNFRNAQEFQGWSIEQLTKELANNNPVIIWVYSHAGIKTSWYTPDGKNIYAVRDEHAVVAVGFVGPQDNPTQIIINDPLIGQVHWSRASFDSKWGIFSNSGVVVY